MVDTAKSTRILTRALTWFFLRTVPSSRNAKPACIASTMMPPSRTNSASALVLLTAMKPLPECAMNKCNENAMSTGKSKKRAFLGRRAQMQGRTDARQSLFQTEHRTGAWLRHDGARHGAVGTTTAQVGKTRAIALLYDAYTIRIRIVYQGEMMIKTAQELILMAEAGRLLAGVFGMLDRTPLVGMSTLQVDTLVERFIVDQLQSRPASKGQYGYGFVLNASVNDVVCHGVPAGDAVLRDGDIVNFDITLEKNGYLADSSKMYLIGQVAPAARRLVQVTYEAMWKGIRAVRPGARLGDIGWVIERHAKRNGCSVVREYCGHGIGRQMHEAPQVRHFGERGTGLVLQEGMVFTIEPMLNAGGRSVRTEADGWTVVTRDGSLSAQWEHTVAVTKDGAAVLTLRTEEAGMVVRAAAQAAAPA